MKSMPLFPQTERVEPLGTIDGQHSIQMIDFVL
jgi:hypothetical protein